MSNLPSSVASSAYGAGKTTRMIEYAIEQARKGNTVAIIANGEAHRTKLYKAVRDAAASQGCAWVVGQGDSGGAAGNIEVYQVSHCLVHEQAPGDYGIRGFHEREILVDNDVYEDRYRKVLENYQRWL